MRSRASNQRDYFRVDCQAIVSVRLIGDHVPAGRSAESYFDEAAHLGLLRDLQRLDQENSQLLHALSDQDRNLGTYLHAMNRKFDLLARHIAALSPELKQSEEQQISISEGGLGFNMATPPEIGALVALRITLLPAFVTLAVFATVVKLLPGPDGPTQVSANFENLQETERQLIARHVMQVQMANQRRKMGRES